jgi:PAS domain S-box-containing protein
VKVFEAYDNMYRFEHLPAFAQFILEQHVSDFIRDQLSLAYHLQIPLLDSLAKRYTPEQMIELSKPPTTELLTAFAHNKALEQIHRSMEKWVNDQLPLIGKFQLAAKDITLLNYVRLQAFKKLIPRYTTDLQLALALTSELDIFFLGNNTTAFDVYIDLMENKIKEETKFGQKLIEASPAITYVYDLVKKKEVFVTGKVKEVLGYSPEEFLGMGKDILLHLHPADVPHFLQHIEYLAKCKDDKIEQLEYRFKHKDGSYRWLRTYEVIFRRDEHDTPVEVLGKIFEVTKGKQIELDLEKRQQQLLEAQAIAHIGSYEWNITEGQSSNTPEVLKIFEMDRSEKFHQFITYIHPEDLTRVQDAIEQSFITGKYECTYRYIRNGKEKVIWSLGRVEFENNKPLKLIGTVQDITEITQIERELRLKTKELEQSNERLEQFAFVTSHDLKEPLRKILIFADRVLLEENENLSRSSLQALEKVIRASKTMRQMIDDILQFSLLQSNEERVSYSLEAIVKEVTEVLEEMIDETGAQVVCSNLPNAFIVPSQFRQLMLNLLTNSIKFAKPTERPEIKIECSWLKEKVSTDLKAADQYLQVTITDNGIGFSSIHTQNIFGLFKRLHSKSEFEGSGVGLAIAKKIVDNHGGIITAESEPNKGATFKIIIPQ